jgi:hypothetical protein
MDSSFDVIDLKSGNVTGGFNSEDDALASLRRAVGAHGPRAIQDLSLLPSSIASGLVRASHRKETAQSSFPSVATPAFPPAGGEVMR